MKEIKIDGLTKEHCKMLDTMWSLESADDFNEWAESLSAKELKMASTLKELLLAHVIDEVADINIAKDYLKKYRL